MRNLFTTLALTVTVLAVSASESSAQWRNSGTRAFNYRTTYSNFRAYTPFAGLYGNTSLGFGSQNYYSQGYYTAPSYYPAYSAPTYNYPLYNHPTFRNAGFPRSYNYNRWYR